MSFESSASIAAIMGGAEAVGRWDVQRARPKNNCGHDEKASVGAPARPRHYGACQDDPQYGELSFTRKPDSGSDGAPKSGADPVAPRPLAKQDW